MDEKKEIQKGDIENKAVETVKPARRVIRKRAKPRYRKVPPPIDKTPPDQKVDQRSANQVIKDAVNSVNKVLVLDPNGDVMMKFPTFRDPETKAMQYEERLLKWVDVPPNQVLYYTQSTIIDLHSDHSATVVVGNRRTVVVFDRTYTYKGKVYHRCAYIPDDIIRAGILFEKKINKVTRLPVAVLKKIQGTNTEAYQIIGKAETDYRDLKRIFERVFIKKGVPATMQEDQELIKFMHDSVPPDEMEVG